MKPTWRYWINKEGGNFTGKYYEFKSFKVYIAYRWYVAREIMRKDYNESFTGSFIKNGFKPSREISPTENWFGVSVYRPDLTMTKGNKKLQMSLQGMYMPFPKELTEGIRTLLQQCACKYIGLYENEVPVYETWSGQLPDKETLNKFLN